MWFCWVVDSITTDVIEYCAENDWGLSWTVNAETLGSYASLAAMKSDPTTHITPNYIETDTIPLINQCEDYGVKTQLEIEECVFYYPFGGYPIPTTDPRQRETTAEEYEEYYGANMDLLEATALDGYGYEWGFDNAAEWLRNKTPNKHLTYYWISDATGVDPAYETYYHLFDPPHDVDWRLNLVDSVVEECYYTPRAEWMVNIFNYLKEFYPDKQYGVCTTINLDDDPPIIADEYGHGNHSTFWQETDYGYFYPNIIPPLTEAEGNQTARKYLLQAKEATGGAEFTECRLYLRNRTDAWRRLAGWYETLPIFDAGTKGHERMTQTGITPRYFGAAAYCKYPILPDTFVNTGNEIILLKDYDTASTHDITVTSTDTPTHVDYNLALSPDRGTLIGPYPLDDYGALPTITYDSTNLYVSVLKVSEL